MRLGGRAADKGHVIQSGTTEGTGPQSWVPLGELRCLYTNLLCLVEGCSQRSVHLQHLLPDGLLVGARDGDAHRGWRSFPW